VSLVCSEKCFDYTGNKTKLAFQNYLKDNVRAKERMKKKSENSITMNNNYTHWQNKLAKI